MAWLAKRPWILEQICFGTSTPDDRKLLLGSHEQFYLKSFEHFYCLS